jgi:hypothetical protein
MILMLPEWITDHGSGNAASVPVITIVDQLSQSGTNAEDAEEVSADPESGAIPHFSEW